MAIIVEWQLPYTAWDWIEITANKVIKVLLREENNLIKLNEDNELYTDLQLVSWITPSDEFPVWVTVGQVLKKDWWLVNGTLLNFQTTSGDYGRWLYWADGHMYYDHWTWTFTQIYSWAEVDDLFTQLRWELSTVAFTWDYNDLKNRPEVVAPSDWELTISKNWEPIGTFTANQATDETIDIEVPTTVAELSDASDYAKTADLSTVATTWDYDDLLDKPTIWDATITIKKNNTTVDSFTTNATSNKNINITVPTTVAELTDSSDYVTDTELSNALADYTPTANLAAVALSNDYDDLDDKPTIWDATLTIQKNWTTVNSIKMNATTDVTANIVVPTDTSDLTNNAWFVTNQVNDTAYGSSWDWDTINAPSKNAVYDKIQTVVWDINTINWKIPSAASSSNQLTDKNYVDSSINSVSAYYITKNAAWDQFATYAELSSATTFYSGWVVRTPTRNDYTIVLADETHDNELTRYIYNNGWEYQYSINESPMTQAQLDALNSGITSSKVTTYDWYATWKQATLVSGTNIKTINNTSVLWSGNIDTNQVSDTAYASSWNGATTTAPSQNAVYDKINAMDTTISGKADSSSLSTVATSWSYADLSNKPTIWSWTLTLQKNGTAIDTFSANATANKTINVTVPTKTSDLTNDSNFVASTSLATVATSGSYSDLSNTPTVDTSMSDSSTNAVQNKVIKSYVDTTAGSSAAAKVSDTAYASSWNWVTGIAPSKNAVYDKISAMDTTIWSKADDSDVVHLSWAETIVDWLKVFESDNDPAPNSWSVTTSITLKWKNLKKWWTAWYKYTSIDFKDQDDALVAKFSGLTTPDWWSGFMAWAWTDPTSTSWNLWLIADNTTNSKLFLIPPTTWHNYWAVRYDYYNNNTVRLSTNQTIAWTKTFSTSPVVPSKTADATNSGTAIATEAQVYKKQDTISDLATIRSWAAAGATAVQPWDLATVATSGSYNDLSNRPTIPVVDSVLSTTSTNALQNKVITEALNWKLDWFTISFAWNWTWWVHPVRFCSVDYTTATSEKWIFIKMSLVNSHWNGQAWRFLEDVILLVTYTWSVEWSIYRYFWTPTLYPWDYYDYSYWDIFWTIDTTNKIVDFYVLMHQYSYTRMTPYFRLNTSNWWVITQAYEWSWNPEYSSWTKTRALIYDYSKIPSKTSQLTNDSGFITSADLPTVNNWTLTINQGWTSKWTFTANQSSASTVNLETWKLVTQTEYNNISWASSDWNLYIIYKTV